MVNEHTQAIDSSPIKANANMDSLELKVPANELDVHLAKIRHISNRDKEVFRKAFGTLTQYYGIEKDQYYRYTTSQ